MSSVGSFLEQRLVIGMTRRPAVSFQEQRITIEPARRPAVVFLLLVVCSCGRVMTGIAKVIVSFFRKGEEVAIERHRSRVPVDKEAHRGVSELKKHLTEFLGLKEPGGGGGGLLPYKRLMGMCRWMGSHFHNWIDYNGVAFSIQLLEWGRTFWDFWGEKLY